MEDMVDGLDLNRNNLEGSWLHVKFKNNTEKMIDVNISFKMVR